MHVEKLDQPSPRPHFLNVLSSIGLLWTPIQDWGVVFCLSTTFQQQCTLTLHCKILSVNIHPNNSKLSKSITSPHCNPLLFASSCEYLARLLFCIPHVVVYAFHLVLHDVHYGFHGSLLLAMCVVRVFLILVFLCTNVNHPSTAFVLYTM